MKRILQTSVVFTVIAGYASAENTSLFNTEPIARDGLTRLSEAVHYLGTAVCMGLAVLGVAILIAGTLISISLAKRNR
jgi:hypothetical protein